MHACDSITVPTLQCIQLHNLTEHPFHALVLELTNVALCCCALSAHSCPCVSVGLSEGRGALLADPDQTQQLESDMAHLAPKLSSLAVLLRAAVLPAMSLVNPEVASRLQVLTVSSFMHVMLCKYGPRWVAALVWQCVACWRLIPAC